MERKDWENYLFWGRTPTRLDGRPNEELMKEAEEINKEADQIISKQKKAIEHMKRKIEKDNYERKVKINPSNMDEFSKEIGSYLKEKGIAESPEKVVEERNVPPIPPDPDIYAYRDNTTGTAISNYMNYFATDDNYVPKTMVISKSEYDELIKNQRTKETENTCLIYIDDLARTLALKEMSEFYKVENIDEKHELFDTEHYNEVFDKHYDFIYSFQCK